MLPTSGLFKDIDCPYYDNYCGRPYCHFRHRKRNPDSAEDSQDGESTGSEFPTYKPTPKSQLAQVKSHIPISYVPDTVVRPERSNRIPTMYNYMEKVTYKPTPLSELSKNNAINTTAELINKELLSKIGESKIEVDRVLADGSDSRGNGNCDIDFEELSMEFDMIDDIINESPSVENNQSHAEDKETKNKPIENKNTVNESNKPSHSSSKSRSKSEKSSRSSKESTSKSKDDKSKQSRSSSTSSSSNHKSSSHKSKSDKHTTRSKSKDRIKEKSSDAKPKDDKKDHKSSSSTSTSSKDKKESSSKDKHHYSSKSGSKSNSSNSKHKEYDMSKRKEKSDKIKEKHRKDPKETSLKLLVHSDNDQDVDDLFNEDREEECKRIFDEYKPEVVERQQENQSVEVKQLGAVEEYVPTTKKRVAHSGADRYVSKLGPVKQKSSHNAGAQMTNRYKLTKNPYIARAAQVREEDDIEALLSKHGMKRNVKEVVEAFTSPKKIKEERKEESSNTETLSQSISLIDEIINGKPCTNTPIYKPTPIAKLNADDSKGKPFRIAPAMNVCSIQQARARIAEFTKRKEAPQKTTVQTVGKGNKRVAHIPDSSLAELPDILQPESKKIPANVRTRYLTMIAEECVKLYLSKDDAYSRAVNEEFKVLERCAAIATYRNSAMLTLNRIRKEVQVRESKGLGPMSSDETTEANPESQFRGAKFYVNITRYVLGDGDLEEHGYPREGPIPGKAVIKAQKQLPRVNLDENQRLCCRCFKVYLVDAMGYPMFKDDCIYHPLKKRTLRGDRIYLCCKSPEDMGCVTSNTHVSENDETELLGYQTTMEPESDDDVRSRAVYALDCEMCYTTKGLELTRVTIIDPDCKTVYESLVKPLNPIIDYNTQFSGITKDQMDRTSTNILQVQANILHLCNSKTILIGHSLESDMKALKIIHGCVIDTAILFPHRLGLPHKRALRALASEYLNKIIQSNVAGHDSAEDAITCMELVIWKLKEDMKLKGVK
ncbi:hypothetical protein AMK59_5062 [Oryctes borbonicus]|uniref:Exonuclease domain-containing protein n=1 Tax=Oryctes borbonicus TaxID=1629725 RepID=A0A0T6B1H8_9SCAR|nr:hypothetical protein AMK59_5062 [Oryctes borbonicus]